MRYSLLHEEWIPVLYRNGKVKCVGIRKALEDAHVIRQIAASNPMDRVAIPRFLLALLFWCKGNAQSDERSTSEISFPLNWFEKLDDNEHCFDLLGEGKRFYQYKHDKKPEKNKKLSVNYLTQDVPTGANFWHFRHSIDNINGLCPACCAIGLLRIPAFATSGGRGKTPGINAKPPVYVIPLGSSLAESLRLSWREVSGLDLGTPAWVNPEIKLPAKGNVPLLTRLTWLPRRVWLDDPESCKSSCISCGSRAYLIKQCIFAGIGSQKADGDGQSRALGDPHVIHEGKKVIWSGDALAASDAAAGQWARIMTGILGRQKDYVSRRVLVVGFATVQNDKYLEATEYVISIPASSDVQSIQDKINKWQKEGPNLVQKAKPKASSRKHIEIPAIVDSIRPHIEGIVSARANELLAGDESKWEQAACEYGPMMATIAKSLSPGYTTAAVQRRRQIVGVKPDARAKTNEARKPNRKKGLDK